jgi:hypothetical protein
VIPLGEGFFLQPVANGTLTFVGEVATGNVTTDIAAGFSVKANPIPVAAAIPGGSIGHDGDNIYVWDRAGNQWVTITYLDTYGWFDGSAETNGPVIPVGDAAFFQNTGALLPWVQVFNP